MISNERFISLCVQKVMLYENAREDQDEFLNIDDVCVHGLKRAMHYKLI